MSCGDAVIFWVTCDARERVLASLLVVVFEKKPIKIQTLYFQHDKSLLRVITVGFLVLSQRPLPFDLTCKIYFF